MWILPTNLGDTPLCAKESDFLSQAYLLYLEESCSRLPEGPAFCRTDPHSAGGWATLGCQGTLPKWWAGLAPGSVSLSWVCAWSVRTVAFFPGSSMGSQHCGVPGMEVQVGLPLSGTRLAPASWENHRTRPTEKMAEKMAKSVFWNGVLFGGCQESGRLRQFKWENKCQLSSAVRIDVSRKVWWK